MVAFAIILATRMAMAGRSQVRVSLGTLARLLLKIEIGLGM